MTPRKIYLASSWRNTWYEKVLPAIRKAGHEVYDFRNPAPGNTGFQWSEIDPGWFDWNPAGFVKSIKHPIAQAGFALDKAALEWCDTCVLVLPCGRSAHLEAGYAAGQGKDVFFLLHKDKFEPELMYELGTGYAVDVPDLLRVLTRPIGERIPTTSSSARVLA